VAWMRMMGAESVEYHRATILERGDDYPRMALAYYASSGETPLRWGRKRRRRSGSGRPGECRGVRGSARSLALRPQLRAAGADLQVAFRDLRHALGTAHSTGDEPAMACTRPGRSSYSDPRPAHGGGARRHHTRPAVPSGQAARSERGRASGSSTSSMI
jgi:hypothetical protein